MKQYKKINYILLIAFIILYPILPSYGPYSADIILYTLVFLNIIGFIFIKKERTNVIRNIKNIFKDKIFLSLILLNFSMYISIFVALDKRLTLTNSIRFSLYLFIFYLVSYTIKNTKQISMVLNAFIFTAVLSGLTSVFQIVKLSFLGYRLDSTVRIDSFLENSNNLGAYTVLSFFIVLMFIIKSKNKSSKIFFGFLLILLLASIISCQSRNALIGLLIGSFLIAALYDKRFILLSIILPIPLFLIPQSRLRILQIFDSSQNSSRFQIWESAKMMIKDNPIFGIGYNNFEVNYPIYVANNENLFISEGYLPLHPHNIFLNIQAELGILGTISFILFISITIFTLLKLIRLHTDNNINGILIGITCGFISLQFMNLIDNFYNAPKVALSMFVILAVANYHKMHWYNR